MNTMANWVKTTPYGDYKDPLQNHKFDKDMHFKDEESMTVIIRTKQHELLHQCRVLMTHGKHVGSKPHRNLRNALTKRNNRISELEQRISELEMELSSKSINDIAVPLI